MTSIISLYTVLAVVVERTGLFGGQNRKLTSLGLQKITGNLSLFITSPSRRDHSKDFNVYCRAPKTDPPIHVVVDFNRDYSAIGGIFLGMFRVTPNSDG